MSQELETLIGDLIEASPRGVPPHPAPRRLLDYHARQLDEPAAAEVREHLVHCRACAAALVDLGELGGAAVGEEGTEEVADYGTAASWRALAPRLAEASPEPDAEEPENPVSPNPASSDLRSSSLESASPESPGLDSSSSESPSLGSLSSGSSSPGSSGLGSPSPGSPSLGSLSSGTSGSWWPRLAAALALVTLGLGIWGTWLWSSRHALEDRLARFETPQANAEVVYLDALMRSGSAPPEISPQAGRVMVFLTPPEQPAAARYRVEIRDHSAQLLAEVGRLMPQDLGALRFSLSAGSLGLGSLEVLLFEDGESDLLATYALEVVEAPPAAPEP